MWGRVRPGIRPELTGEAEIHFARGIEASVPGPHAGHRLAHRTEGVRNCSRADGLAGGAEAPAVASRKDLKEGNGIGRVLEERIEVEFGTEFDPQVPMS